MGGARPVSLLLSHPQDASSPYSGAAEGGGSCGQAHGSLLDSYQRKHEDPHCPSSMPQTEGPNPQPEPQRQRMAWCGRFLRTQTQLHSPGTQSLLLEYLTGMGRSLNFGFIINYLQASRADVPAGRYGDSPSWMKPFMTSIEFRARRRKTHSPE